MSNLFGTDYLEEDNNLLQIQTPETRETIQQIILKRPTKTIEEIKEEARCIRMREAQITRYAMEPTFDLHTTIRLVPKEEKIEPHITMQEPNPINKTSSVATEGSHRANGL